MKLVVRKFGPIESVEYRLSNFNIFVGRQSSGKSTITKLIYYFLNGRDEVYNFIIEILQSRSTSKVRQSLEKILRQRFVEIFGPTVQDPDLYIEFEYSQKLKFVISAEQRDSKMLRISISENLIGLITEIVRQNEAIFRNEISKVRLFKSNMSSSHDLELEKIRQDIEDRVCQYFGFDENLLFIPAGRSLLSTLGDQLRLVNPQIMDFTMRLFINKIATTKVFFRSSLEQIIQERAKLNNSKWLSTVTMASGIMNRLLQGSFIVDQNIEKIVLPNGKFVKINFTSSGQQESIWIVLSLFLIALEKVNAIVFIEEPEAHLFPNAQKEIIDYVILLNNRLGTRFILTTHSPYILSSINNNMYADKLSRQGKKVSKIINDGLPLDSSQVQATMVCDGGITNIIDNELSMIDVGAIDSCSRDINKVFDLLEDLEFANDK